MRGHGGSNVLAGDTHVGENKAREGKRRKNKMKIIREIRYSNRTKQKWLVVVFTRESGLSIYCQSDTGLLPVSPGCRRGAEVRSFRWSMNYAAEEAVVWQRQLRESRRRRPGRTSTGDGVLGLAGPTWDRSPLPSLSVPSLHARLREKEEKSAYLRGRWAHLGYTPSDPPTHQQSTFISSYSES